MPKKNYFDFSLFDEVGDAMDLFANTVRNAFEFDALAGKDIFNAVVLTHPIPMDIGQISSFVTPSEKEIEDDIPRFTFKARIVGPNSPHLFLPDPCNQATAKEIQQQQNIQNIIDMHTTVIANNATEKPSIGNIVRIRIEQGTFSVNPQTAEYVGLLTADSDAVNNLLKFQSQADECKTTLNDLFNNSYTGASVSSIQIKRTFATYNGKTRSGESNVEVENGKLREAFVPLRAAKDGLYTGNRPIFVTRATDQFEKLAQQYKDEHPGKVLKINSSYRSFKEQIEMKISKTNQGKPGEAATPGQSNHGWGVAFDVGGTGDDGPNRFKSKIYLWLDKNAPKYGFVNPPNLREDGSRPEAWHWENVDIRNQLFKTTKIQPGWVTPDGDEIPPEEREQS